MSSEIIFRDAASPSDPDANLLLRWENTINTPIISAAWEANGEAISDVYTIAATSATTVNVTAEDTKNEIVGAGINVVADDSTPNYGVIPGVGIVFSSSLANGWTAKLSIGALMDSGAVTSDRFNVGIVESDDISTQRRIVAYNVGTEDSAESEVYSLPGFFLEDDAQPFIKTLENHSSIARQGSATEGDFDITYQDYQAGSPNTVDVYVGGVKTIEDAKLDGQERYEHGAGNGYIDAVDKFKGMAIIFVDDPGDPTAQTHTYHVRTGSAYVELALDSSGSPGTWGSGPLTLTELGEVSGVITPSGYVYFWFRTNIPSAAVPGDRRMFNLRARGLTV